MIDRGCQGKEPGFGAGQESRRDYAQKGSTVPETGQKARSRNRIGCLEQHSELELGQIME